MTFGTLVEQLAADSRLTVREVRSVLAALIAALARDVLEDGQRLRVPALGGWELHSPWWVTGTRGEADDEAQSICAAVMATSEEAAKEVIRAAHDNRPRAIQWRFANECPEGWSPFTDRFPRRKWMKWPT